MTVELMDLWLPILLSAVIVFVASAVIWMALPYHKGDFKALPDESAVNALVAGTPAGLYMFPNCHGQDVKSEAFKARWESGPWGFLTVVGSKPNFGRNLLVTFLEMLLVSFVAAYLATIALPAGAEYMRVFRFVGTAAVLGYVLGSFGHDAFKAQPARMQLTCALDGLVFALLTAGVFAWLWPDGAGSVGPGVIPTP